MGGWCALGLGFSVIKDSLRWHWKIVRKPVGVESSYFHSERMAGMVENQIAIDKLCRSIFSVSSVQNAWSPVWPVLLWTYDIRNTDGFPLSEPQPLEDRIGHRKAFVWTFPWPCRMIDTLISMMVAVLLKSLIDRHKFKGYPNWLQGGTSNVRGSLT